MWENMVFPSKKQAYVLSREDRKGLRRKIWRSCKQAMVKGLTYSLTFKLSEQNGWEGIFSPSPQEGLVSDLILC